MLKIVLLAYSRGLVASRIKSNVTDPDSASQVNLLLAMIEATAAVREACTLITADAGYHGTDNAMRQRNERFAQQAKHKTKGEVLHDKRQRTQCIRRPDTRRRRVSLHTRMPDDPQDPLHRMREAINSAHGRRLYSQRIATVEPIFGNLRHNKRPNRFTLRGKDKVGTQWRLFCLEIEEKVNHNDPSDPVGTVARIMMTGHLTLPVTCRCGPRRNWFIAQPR